MGLKAHSSGFSTILLVFIALFLIPVALPLCSAQSVTLDSGVNVLKPGDYFSLNATPVENYRDVVNISYSGRDSIVDYMLTRDQFLLLNKSLPPPVEWDMMEHSVYIPSTETFWLYYERENTTTYFVFYNNGTLDVTLSWQIYREPYTPPPTIHADVVFLLVVSLITAAIITRRIKKE
jgi:hypothetical protein